MRLRAFFVLSMAFLIGLCLTLPAHAQNATINGTETEMALVYGVQGQIAQDNNVSGSAGVHGVGGSANTYGVFGEAGPSSLSAGVYGRGGVRGSLGTVSFEFLVSGVVGFAQYNPGVLGQSRYAGVVGRVYDGTDAFQAQGTLGSRPGIVSGPFYAVYAEGNTGATGIKNFVEPHPTDPMKTIKFVSLEGNEAGTYFRGRGQFVNGKATIRVPEEFRLVTEEEGLTVNVTPMGRIASVGVITADLEQISVESTADVDFSFIVYGVRRGYKDFQPVTQSGEFMPHSPDARIPAYLNAAQKERVVANGTYNADGTVNMHTALKLGWDKVWAERPAR